jgi:membrane-anchored glycerophosphoryl diester phosphodiesterase (GDPDase)
MKKRNNIMINGYIKRIGIGLLVSLMVVAAICLIKSNYRNIETFSNVLFYIGLIELCVGGISFIGSTMVKGNVIYQLSRTASDESIQKRNSNDVDSNEQRFKFVIYMSIIGALMIGFSLVVAYVLI